MNIRSGEDATCEEVILLVTDGPYILVLKVQHKCIDRCIDATHVTTMTKWLLYVSWVWTYPCPYHIFKWIFSLHNTYTFYKIYTHISEYTGYLVKKKLIININIIYNSSQHRNKSIHDISSKYRDMRLVYHIKSTFSHTVPPSLFCHSYLCDYGSNRCSLSLLDVQDTQYGSIQITLNFHRCLFVNMSSFIL